MSKKIFRYKGAPTMGEIIDDLLHIPKETKPIKRGVKRDYHNSFSTKLNDNLPKDLIVIYDVPYNKRRERDWFRRHLKKFNFIMIQKSVWIGPSPLPKEFLEYVRLIGLKDNFNTYKLAKPIVYKRK